MSAGRTAKSLRSGHSVPDFRYNRRPGSENSILPKYFEELIHFYDLSVIEYLLFVILFFNSIRLDCHSLQIILF